MEPEVIKKEGVSPNLAAIPSINAEHQVRNPKNGKPHLDPPSTLC